MKKLMITLTSILILLFVISCTATVHATEEEIEDVVEYKFTDFSNAEIVTSLRKDAHTETMTTGVSINGVTTKSTSIYFVYLSNENTELSVDSEEWFNLGSDNLEIPEYYSSPIFQLNGDIYISIMEQEFVTDGEKKIQVSAQKLSRVAYTGKKIKIYFFNDHTSIYNNADDGYGDDITRKANYKIGVVTDNNVLKALRDGKDNAYSLLMDYAKKDNGIGTGTLTIVDGMSDNEEALSKLDIIDNSMYYCYVELDDENGKFFPVEDVDIYFGFVGDSVRKKLI